jgi:predicted nucleic acid-binding protein
MPWLTQSGSSYPSCSRDEVLSVLCRRFRQGRDVSLAMNRLVRLGLKRIRLDERLVRRVARLVYDHCITGYDACYAALAFELDGRWLTFDRAAHARVEALGICEVPAETRGPPDSGVVLY